MEFHAFINYYIVSQVKYNRDIKHYSAYFIHRNMQFHLQPPTKLVDPSGQSASFATPRSSAQPTFGSHSPRDFKPAQHPIPHLTPWLHIFARIYPRLKSFCRAQKNSSMHTSVNLSLHFPCDIHMNGWIP